MAAVDLYWLPLGAGEMWNSNAVIAWVLSRGGIDARSVRPPGGGRAPGFHAGIALAETDRQV